MQEPKRAARLLMLWSAAVAAGVIGALAIYGFRLLIEAAEWLFTRQFGGLVHAAQALAPWQRVLVPAAGGVLAGAVLQAGARWTGAAPHVDYIDAARLGDARLNDRTTATRTLSALLSVGSGSSIGREGPMVQLSAWLASLIARALPLDEAERAAVLVCGIAAGIASAYHAPVAGVVFILELALGFLARPLAAPVLVAAVAGSALVHHLVGAERLFPMPPVDLPGHALWFALATGVGFGLIGLGLLKLLDLARRGFHRIGPLWLRLGLGGLIVGLVSAAVPQVWGNGYSVMSELLARGDLWRLVALVLAAKLLATAASAGSGAIGGVFTPTLFVGAAGGYLAGELVAMVLGAGMADPRAFAVVGMAAVLAAVTRAPLMSIVMVLEMTGQYHLNLSIMLASAVAYGISTRFDVTPLYGNPIEGRDAGARRQA
ncbi:MAG: Cl-channel voltage-gated family protein [Proteobacteria bacterium]|nr:Cl-channel voltage-gated family protein [Pseudomonadota bacterium]